MLKLGSDKVADPALLAVRVLLMLLFVIFGWEKFTGFSGTVAYMAQTGLPVPFLAALVAVVMELFVGLAILFGVLTRPLAILLLLYTFVTALVGHPYWSLSGMARFEAEINFYKNFGIMGGLLGLYVSGAGRYSVDRLLRLG